MRSLLPGAHWATRRSRLATMLAIAVLGSLLSFGTSAATPQGALAADPPYLEVETYYLKLLNCTRTGGWVLSDGTCKGYGTGKYSKYVKPIARSSGISRVSRSWAKYLAVNNRCVHGDVAARLRRAGYTSYRWAENIGCRDGYSNAYKAVLATHLKFQSEKAANGGHWRIIKDPRYTSVGVGVWRSGGRTRLVTDFYRP